MGFNAVYRALQDVFPQVDSRVLRAVAIEHPKDADIAVEVVLSEIIPYLPPQSQSNAISFSNKNENSLSLSEVVVDGGKGKAVQFEAAMIPEHSSEAGPSSTDIVYNGLPKILEKHGDNSNDNLDSDLLAASIDVNGFFKNCDEESLGGYELPVPEYIQEKPSFQFLSMSEPHSALNHELDPGSSSKPMSENNDFVMEEVSEDESMMTSMLTKSDQITSTQLLDDTIEDARNEKKTLVSTMNSVVELMREVEEKEIAAEKAKEEANTDCSSIFAKVDEIKQALGRAKEANDMHAGEVYAEKAILATELKELQHRLFTLSDERNKSLAILHEMRGDLETRLGTLLEEIEAAKGEKLEKEKFAREALGYQESQLEIVVEESKKLKREAEENSKLQEFLMDRGRAIDVLQGEISVKCQDVRLLKEKFDKRIPLSRSLSSSQTSSILASPTSSFRRSPALSEAEAETFQTPKKSLELDDHYIEWTSRSEAHSPKSPNGGGCFPSGERKQSDSWKLLINDDDDWEMFDKSELSTGA